jgi:hypothetical protein
LLRLRNKKKLCSEGGQENAESCYYWRTATTRSPLPIICPINCPSHRLTKSDLFSSYFLLFLQPFCTLNSIPDRSKKVYPNKEDQLPFRYVNRNFIKVLPPDSMAFNCSSSKNYFFAHVSVIFNSCRWHPNSL